MAAVAGTQTHDYVPLLPPIFRVVLMIALGLAGFGVDLHVLQRWGMNLWSASGPMRLPMHRGALATSVDPQGCVRASGAGLLYLFAAVHLACALLGWALYRYSLDRGARTWAAQGWETATLLGLLALWLVPGPFRLVQRAGARLAARLATPSLHQTIQFSDVIAADILTSFAKVLGHVWLSLVVVLYTLQGALVDDSVLLAQQSSLAVPVLVSLPFLIRLRQCVSEYLTLSPLARQTRSTRPLYNALKYASALPVIWLSTSSAPPRSDGVLVHPSGVLYFLWLAAVLFNTLFSFWWDITNDWGLDLLFPSTFRSMVHSSSHLPPLHRRTEERTHILGLDDDADTDELPLRPEQAMHARRGSMLRLPDKPLPLPPMVYSIFIAVDLVLRFTWSLKLSSHFQFLVVWHRGLLILEAFELVRRSVWVLLRVEWELVKREGL